MTKAMPFLQKVILLSYDPRPLDEGLLRTLISPLCAMFLLLNRELSAVYGPAFTIRAVLPSSSLIF